jgi:ketosteroid isomerase-like protein
MAAKGWEEEEKRRVLSLVRAVPKAIEKKNTEKILKIYDTNDPRFCTFEDTPDFLGLMDGPKFRRFVKDLRKLESSSIHREEIRVVFAARSVAIVTGMDDWRSRQNGKETKGISRFTIVLRKKKREWKVIHEHFTKVA